MRKLLLFTALSLAGFSVAAQQQPSQPANPKGGAGAKPHTHFDQLDRGLHRRSGAEVIAPAK